jgi:hypothetical protein
MTCPTAATADALDRLRAAARVARRRSEAPPSAIVDADDLLALIDRAQAVQTDRDWHAAVCALADAVQALAAIEAQLSVMQDCGGLWRMALDARDDAVAALDTAIRAMRAPAATSREDRG